MMLPSACGASIAPPCHHGCEHAARESPEQSWRRDQRSHMLATSYPLREVFWAMLIFFAFVIWLWMLFVVIGDIFRRHDIGGLAKTAWILVLGLLADFWGFFYLCA